ncbi:hypothetical protein SM12BL3_12150 [Serratia marcescens]|nr:hypothetical protein SM12BL3_12150 [Serratia marcescens]
MAKNEFLPFGTTANANVLSNADYLALPARPTGFGAGVAKSEELNKVWRQTSVMANVLAQFIADQSGQDVLDNGDLATLKTNLQNAIKSYVNSGLPAATDTVAGITKLSSLTDSNDTTLAATPAAVKSVMDTATSKADKNTALKNTSGWWKCGSTGVIYQWGTISSSSGVSTANFPIAFPNAAFEVALTVQKNTEGVTLAYVSSTINRDSFGFCAVTGSSGSFTAGVGINYLAIGY